MTPNSISDAKDLSRLDNPFVWKQCIKLKRRGMVQSILLSAMWVLLFGSFFLFEQSVNHRTRSGQFTRGNPALVPYTKTALVLGLASLAGFFCCRNYYLVYPLENRIYHQFQFLWWKKRRIVYRQGEVYAIATDGRKRRSRYGTYWQYRLTAVGMNGSQEPLSNWRRNGLEAWNAEARSLANEVKCRCVLAHPESTLSIELKGGKPDIHFN